MTEKISLFEQADIAYQKKDFKKAFALFLQAAQNGDNSSMSRLALMYGEGEGVNCDLDKSIYWDKKAIEAGNIISLNNLAITYKQLGNIEKAKEYFEKSINAGDYDTALELAKLYIETKNIGKKVKNLLNLVIINEKKVCETSVEEAKKLLSELNFNM